ncbi:GtrA family protein [Undibacterium sp. Ji49W]|uniref:GtrA family protein n=1 Tax=Undibacterium sp. Ji49W TaxID=3413040 RepID=UPI003BF2AEF5
MRLKTFFSFALVGGVGFIVDAGVLWLLNAKFGMNPLLARGPSFLLAVTATWILNSALTFKSPVYSFSRWLNYTLANGLGFFVNFSVYAVLTASFLIHPLISLAISSITALAINFILSLKWVFRR